MKKQQTSGSKDKSSSKLSPAEKIGELLKERPLDLEKWWEVGSLVERFSNTDSQSSSLSRNNITKLGDQLRCAHSELYYARKLAKDHTKQQLQRLQKRGFGWGKMMQVLSVKDRKVRLALIEQAIENNWSASRLRSEMHQRRGYKAEPVSRSRNNPEYVGLQESLRELIRQCRNWMRYDEKVWQGREPSMLADLEDLPKQKMDQDLLLLLRNALGELRKVARACMRLEERLDQTTALMEEGMEPDAK